MPTITINGTAYELPENDGVFSKVPSYNEALIALAELVAAASAFTAPTLTNSWVNFGGGTLADAGYLLFGGVVHLRGTIKSGTIGLSAFTLPTGYRPSKRLVFAAISNDALGRLDVNADGTVVPGGASSVGSNTYFSLDGIFFFVA